jgi:Ca2+-binding EF-hand superfamily protein
VTRVGTVCFGFLMTAAASAAAQPAKPAATAAPKPTQTQVQPQRRAPAPQAVSRAAFLNSMDAEFRKMDADKNGTVTRAEVDGFERAISVLKAQHRNRTLFAKLDADRNGQISQAEFARMASAPPAPDTAATVGRYDLNRDQSINLVEYRTATLAKFDRMDADKDGFVSAAEMKTAGVRK